MSAHAPEHTAGISYVYAVGPAGMTLDASAGGLDGGPLRTVSAHGLSAVVSSVPEDAFSSEGLKAQMENLDRLENMARTHHTVVDAAYRSATVLPMRLATVYLDDTRVQSMLQERQQDFAELLSWLEGHVELGVKVYADPQQTSAVGAGADAPDPAAVAESPGRAYLQRRRAQKRSHQDAYRAAGSLAADAAGRANALARARVVHRPQQGELAGSAGENVANEAYLVPADRVEEFCRSMAGLADDVDGVRIEITGPWAPYSFATPPEASGGGSQ
ncbi:GvpL/GvpF family gas vesicle protein [Streptomyces sp. NBC_00859]|uniref:GvpL/GvpF family gas vesicle protein n=1 Tax=Streptomyces sp. NBC_00859 TaxID=2903682 RepID=UPI00386FD0F5|nr:GvpL/GvpF family gas vesicle protein [Streptomyces sp. NBC_00859]